MNCVWEINPVSILPLLVGMFFNITTHVLRDREARGANSPIPLLAKRFAVAFGAKLVWG